MNNALSQSQWSPSRTVNGVHTLRRRTLLTHLLAAPLALGSVSAAHGGWLDTINQLTGRAGTLHILALDVSISPQVDDPRKLYRQLSSVVLDRVNPGDILLLLPVGNQGQSAVRLEKFDLARSGKSFEDRKNKAITLKAANERIEALLSQTATQTRLLESLAALKPEIAAAKARGMEVNLALGSDVLESSALCDMDNRSFGAAQADGLLKKVHSQGLLMNQPNADGAAVLRAVVVGAGGKTPEAYQTVETFWRKYFTANGFTLMHYGRTVPSGS